MSELPDVIYVDADDPTCYSSDPTEIDGPMAMYVNVDRVAKLEAEVDRMERNAGEKLGELVGILEINPPGEDVLEHWQELWDEIREREHEQMRFRQRVNLAVNDRCSCGGSGPRDPGACDACLIYHMIMQTEEARDE